MIFLYSSFRVSSTWLYSCFRRLDSILAYTEVFNEDLAKISKTEAEDRGPESWPSKHPPGAPYFLEYVPLIEEGGGVTGYTESMAFDCFIPTDGIEGSLSESERQYIRNLVDHAEASRKIALLCCTRSLGRTRAIKSAFPGTHVLIYRNMFQQWCSYCEQAFRSNSYFLETVLKTIECNQHDPFFRFLQDKYDSEQLDSTESFDRFVLFHLYIYGRICDSCDVIVDVNKLSNDVEYRADIELAIANHCGVSIDLSDVRNSIAFSLTDLGSPAEFADRMHALNIVAEREITSREGRKFIGQCIRDAIEEYDRYHFYARSLMKLTTGLITEQETLRQGVADLTASIAKMSEVIAQRDAQLRAKDLTLIATEELASEYRRRLDSMRASWWWRFGNRIARVVRVGD